MAIILFVLIIAAGLFIAYKLLHEEMFIHLRVPSINWPWQKGRMREVVYEPLEQEEQPVVVDALPDEVEVPNNLPPVPTSLDERMVKLESLLFEKNRLLDDLQKNLEAEREHRHEFEKVKTLMDDEIRRLKDQVKSYKSYLKESGNVQNI